tara:strand:+ start:12579 stop:12788 length:210 start_codon:yes stop_codon:yes gene_type:complete
MTLSTQLCAGEVMTDGEDDENITEIDRSFIHYTGFDIADITIGKFGEDYGLENTTSSAWITVMATVLYR